MEDASDDQNVCVISDYCFHLSIDVDIGELYWEDKYFPEVVQRQQLVHSWPVETSAFSSILTTVRIVSWR